MKNQNLRWPEPDFGRGTPSVKTWDRYTVIPAGGESDREARYNAVLSLLKGISAAQRAVNTRDDRGGLMLIKRGTASARNDLDRIDAAIARLSAPSVDQMAAQLGRGYAERGARMCAEAKAAYDARNPHKKGAAK